MANNGPTGPRTVREASRALALVQQYLLPWAPFPELHSALEKAAAGNRRAAKQESE